MTYSGNYRDIFTNELGVKFLVSGIGSNSGKNPKASFIPASAEEFHNVVIKKEPGGAKDRSEQFQCGLRYMATAGCSKRAQRQGARSSMS
jgi:hypothetical protein